MFITTTESKAGIVHFESISHLKSGDIQPIVDAEASGLTKATTDAAMADLKAAGYAPILYASWSFWHDVLEAPKEWPWWMADYNKEMPALPEGATLFAWQFTETGQCPGVVGNCDMNYVPYVADEFSRFLIPIPKELA